MLIAPPPPVAAPPSGALCLWSCAPPLHFGARSYVCLLAVGSDLLANHGEDRVDRRLNLRGEAQAERPVCRLHLYDNGIGGETLPIPDDGQGVVEVDDAPDGLTQAVGHLLLR